MHWHTSIKLITSTALWPDVILLVFCWTIGSGYPMTRLTVPVAYHDRLAACVATAIDTIVAVSLLDVLGEQRPKSIL